MGGRSLRDYVRARVEAYKAAKAAKRMAAKEEKRAKRKRDREQRKSGKVREPRKRAPQPRLPVGPVEQVTFYIPKNFDPERYGFTDSTEQFYVYYFLDLIHQRTARKEANEEGFVQLKSHYVRKVVPPALWREIKDVLPAKKQEGREPVIRRDLLVIKGVKSEGFRLTKRFTREFRRIVCDDDEVNRRIQKLGLSSDQASSLHQTCKLLPVHRWLEGHLRRLHFDASKAAEIIKALRPKPDSKQKPSLYRRQIAWLFQRINEGERSLKCDRFGRVGEIQEVMNVSRNTIFRYFRQGK